MDGFKEKVDAALLAHPTLLRGFSGPHATIALVDHLSAEDDPGDVVCTHPYTEDGLAAAIRCAEVGENDDRT